MRRKIVDVVEQQLCTGCGICQALEPEVFRIVDVPQLGKRPLPLLNGTMPQELGLAASVCPGASLKHGPLDPNCLQELFAGWGPVMEVWEGYATDDEIRKAGSSGGAASALALYGIERGGMGGVIHTAAMPNQPLLNETVISSSRFELLGRTGSRYSPASPCDRLHEHLPKLTQPAVFIGKPCDVAAVNNAVKLKQDWADKIGLTIAFFCAGTPSTQGTLELLAKMGVMDASKLRSLRYRGRGWPGMFTAEWESEDGTLKTNQLTYEESWGFLQRYRQWRCYICPDHTGEFADIAVGDPWYRPIAEGELGSSLIVVRTQRGREFLRAAAANGYITLLKQDAGLLARSQPNLLNARGSLWGRLWALRAAGAAVPQFSGFDMLRFWWKLTLREKVSSLIGTWKRVSRKRLNKRITLTEIQAMQTTELDQ